MISEGRAMSPTYRARHNPTRVPLTAPVPPCYSARRDVCDDHHPVRKYRRAGGARSCASLGGQSRQAPEPSPGVCAVFLPSDKPALSPPGLHCDVIAGWSGRRLPLLCSTADAAFLPRPLLAVRPKHGGTMHDEDPDHCENCRHRWCCESPDPDGWEYGECANYEREEA